jgi:hypothetical protein
VEILLFFFKNKKDCNGKGPIFLKNVVSAPKIIQNSFTQNIPKGRIDNCAGKAT